MSRTAIFDGIRRSLHRDALPPGEQAAQAGDLVSVTPALKGVAETGTLVTADIEQSLLLGAHGPRRLHVVLCNDA